MASKRAVVEHEEGFTITVINKATGGSDDSCLVLEVDDTDRAFVEESLCSALDLL